jgi:Tfp pilus assembly protein PilN
MGELNLIPYEVKKKKNINFKIRQYVAASLIILVLLFTGIYYPKAHLNALKNQDADLKVDVEKGNKILVENVKVKEEIANYKSYTDKVEMLTKQKVIASTKLQGLEKYTPSDIALSSLNYGKGMINITGVTKKFNSISEFAANLQMSKEYNKSTISNIAYNNTEYTFTINVSEVGGAQIEKAK